MELMKWRQDKLNDPFKELFDFEFPMLGYPLLPVAGKGWSGSRAQLVPAIDVAEDKDNVIIRADLPGLKKEDIGVSLDNDVLTIRGERKSEIEKKDKNFHRVERSYGIFERSLSIGIPVDEGKIRATYKEGVLELVLPKKEKEKTKQIEIKAE